MKIGNAVRLRLCLRGHARKKNPLVKCRTSTIGHIHVRTPSYIKSPPTLTPSDLTPTRSPRLTIHTPVFQLSHIQS